MDRVIEVMEVSVGVLVYWFVGVLVYWRAGVLANIYSTLYNVNFPTLTSKVQYNVSTLTNLRRSGIVEHQETAIAGGNEQAAAATPACCCCG